MKRTLLALAFVAVASGAMAQSTGGGGGVAQPYHPTPIAVTTPHPSIATSTGLGAPAGATYCYVIGTGGSLNWVDDGTTPTGTVGTGGNALAAGTQLLVAINTLTAFKMIQQTSNTTTVSIACYK